MFGTLFGRTSSKTISPEKVKELIGGENFILLDVRTPEEYNEFHIPHSISLPLDKIKSGISKITPDKNSRIAVYCLSGARSSRACGILSSMGYSDVSNMGGINTWKYETERGSD